MVAGDKPPPAERLPVWLEAILILAGGFLLLIVLAYLARKWAADHWALLLLLFLFILGALGFSYQIHRQHQELLGALESIPLTTACLIHRPTLGDAVAGCEDVP